MKKELTVGQDALYFSGANVVEVTIIRIDGSVVHAIGRAIWKGCEYYSGPENFFSTSGEGSYIADAITKRITILEIYRDRYSKS